MGDPCRPTLSRSEIKQKWTVDGDNGNGGNGNGEELEFVEMEIQRGGNWRAHEVMTQVYCQETNEDSKRRESELWNLTVKNNDLAAYTQRFQELTMMCTKMVPEEEDRVENSLGTLDNISRKVIAAEPTDARCCSNC
ncbi:hypothetical protein Tco_1076811 [Tanacetum coccineum]